MKIPSGYTIWSVNTSLSVGKWIAVYVGVLTLIVSIASLLTGSSYFGVNGWCMVDAFVAGLFAYKMHMGRRWAYIWMFMYYIYSVYYRVSEGLDVSWLGATGFIICLGNAVIASYTVVETNEPEIPEEKS